MQYTTEFMVSAFRRPDNARVNKQPEPTTPLAILMERDKVSENRLAALTGVPQPTIHRIATGKTKEAGKAVLEPLAAFFQVELEVLRGEAPIPPKGELSLDERELLHNYRQLPGDHQRLFGRSIFFLAQAFRQVVSDAKTGIDWKAPLRKTEKTR